MDKIIYRVKPADILRSLESLIDRTIDNISMQNELAWYDPNDPFPLDYGTDEIMMALDLMADTELENISGQYLVPNGILMFRARTGDKHNPIIDGGIHKQLLDIIAYQIPPMFSKSEGCQHEKKYKNQVSRTLSFWVCKNCKADLGDVD